MEREAGGNARGGENEITAGTVTVKNLRAQTQQTYDQPAAGAAIREELTRRG